MGVEPTCEHTARVRRSLSCGQGRGGGADPERRQLRMLSRPGGVVRRKMPILIALEGAMTIATASGSDDCDGKTHVV